jgi:hypothetical protein
MPLTNEVLLVHIIQPPPAEWLEDVRRRFPGLEVRWHSIPFTESGITTTADVLPRDVLDGVTMLCVYAAPKPETIPAVRFVQLVSAGSDRWAAHPTFLDPKVPFASAGGATPYVPSFSFPICQFCPLLHQCSG